MYTPPHDRTDLLSRTTVGTSGRYLKLFEKNLDYNVRLNPFHTKQQEFFCVKVEFNLQSIWKILVCDQRDIFSISLIYLR